MEIRRSTFILADKDPVVFDSLGNLRNEVARRLEILDPEELKLVWITEFPLFEYDEEENSMLNTILSPIQWMKI